MPLAMEQDSARPGIDVIESSLQKVRDGTAYIGVIGLKYGQTPECPTRNPDELSITELEFNEAMNLERPILLFIMGEDHDVKKRDIEQDPEKIKKLDAFRERAKLIRKDGKVHRVYCVFQSLEEFDKKAIQAVGELSRFLENRNTEPADPPEPEIIEPPVRDTKSIPQPPAFHAVPPYIGSHTFTGRAHELGSLSSWAGEADPYPVFLFEAIGGSGKSMLTWEWVRNHAPRVRDDWAGRFWYSFYERGAVMSDFCAQALAYMTGEPLKDLQKQKTLALADRLLAELRRKPWLIVLDGLERILVTYNRADAAQLSDEEASLGKDLIADRSPCAAVRTEDDDLLRALAGPNCSSPPGLRLRSF